MTRWRKKIEAAGAEQMLAETIAAGLDLKVIRPQSLWRVVVDITVQERAVAYPTDAKIFDDMRCKLVRLTKREGIELRQSYQRLGPQRRYAVGRNARGQHHAGIRKHTRMLRTYLGRVLRDIDRKLPQEKRSESWQQALALARKIFWQQRGAPDRIFSVHAPETQCIAKGKLRKSYGRGHKVGLVTTAQGQFVLGAVAFSRRPFDGHTLAAFVQQAEKMMGQAIRGESYVDKGYHGHGYERPPGAHSQNQTQTGTSPATLVPQAQRHRSGHQSHEERRMSLTQLPEGNAWQ